MRMCMSDCMGDWMFASLERILSVAGDSVVWVTLSGLHVHLLRGVL